MTDFNQKTHDTDVGSHGGQSRQMMEVFENQEFGSIRVLQEAGKTFFCASDVAKALGYVNPYAAVKRHCRGPLTKREGVVQKVNQYGDAGEQVVEISFITEGDVYRLIVHSKLPSAERFEHWVFDEVLPSIRKHGVYMSDSILDQVIQHPEVIYTLAQELVAEREQLEGIRKQLDAAQPKADYFDTFVNSEDPQLFLCQGIGSGSSRWYCGLCYQPLYDGFQESGRAKVSGTAGRTAGSHSTSQQRIPRQCRYRCGFGYHFPAKERPSH